MRHLKIVFLFLIVISAIAANAAAPFQKDSSSAPSHVANDINAVSFSKIPAEKVSESKKSIFRSDKARINKAVILTKFLRKRSDPEPNGGKRNSLFKDILIAVALALLSVAVGVFLVIGITLLFPTMSPQGILLISLVVTAVLSVVVPRLLKQ